MPAAVNAGSCAARMSSTGSVLARMTLSDTDPISAWCSRP